MAVIVEQRWAAGEGKDWLFKAVFVPKTAKKIRDFHHVSLALLSGTELRL